MSKTYFIYYIYHNHDYLDFSIIFAVKLTNTANL